MRTTIFPATGVQFRPAFWGVERDLADVVDKIESIWDGRATTVANTNMDFKETDKAYMVAIEMPGVNKKDLDLEIQEDRILVTGLRKNTFLGENEEGQKVSRIITCPKNVERESIQAHLEDGVLYLAMPKLEKARPKKIEISEGHKSGLWSNMLGLKN